MEHSQVVLDFLLRADQQSPEAIEPGMCTFDYPPSGPVARDLPLFLGFFPRVPTYERCNPLRCQFSNIRVVVPLVPMNVVRSFICRLRPLYHHSLHRGFRQFHVMTVTAIHGYSQRDALSFSQRTALGACFVSIGEIGSFSFFPQRGFGRRPVHHLPFPIQPVQFVLLQRTCAPDFLKHPSLTRLLGTVVRRTGRAQAAGKCFPLTASAQHITDRIHGLTIGHPWPATLRFGTLRWLERLDPFPQFVRNAPIYTHWFSCHRLSAPTGDIMFLISCISYTIMGGFRISC